RDDVRTGTGMAECLPAEDLDRLVIENLQLAPRVTAHDAVVTVAVIGIQCYIRDHAEGWMGSLQRTDGPWYQALIMEAFIRIGSLERFLNLREQNHCGDSGSQCFTRLFYQSIQRPPGATGHGGDRGIDRILMEENRQDEVRRRE